MGPAENIANLIQITKSLQGVNLCYHGHKWMDFHMETEVRLVFICQKSDLDQD